MQLKTKIHSKKEKIKRLKTELSSLRAENELLKTQINELKQNKKSICANNNDNLPMNELQSKIKQLENDNESKSMKILHLERIKDEEIALMNQKIKDFEILLNENSVNYVKDISQFRNQIDNYKMQILNYEKFVDIVNFFIAKVNSQIQLNIPSLNNNNMNNNLNQPYLIKDITELQSVLFQIETFINDAINIKKYGINNNNVNVNYDNSLQKFNEDDVPKFENKFLEEEISVNKDKSGYNRSNISQSEDGIYKTLEERVNLLENKMNKKSIASSRKRKKSNNKSIVKRNHNQNNIGNVGISNMNPNIRSKSLNKGVITISSPTTPSNNNLCNVKSKKKKKIAHQQPLQPQLTKNKQQH